MNRIHFIFLALVFSSQVSFSQSAITGELRAQNEEVPFAHVLLFQLPDSVFLKGAVADENGRFVLNHDTKGSFFVRIQSLGYQDYLSASFGDDELMDLGTLQLTIDAGMLSEVVVEGQRPVFEKKIDRTIVNVQNSVTNVGNNALNVLAKSPTVMINRTTNEINLMGKQGVLVMINNKQVRMEAADVIALLDGMSSDNIETIELITAPPASYDAQGNAGIININTVQNNEEGLIGRVSSNVAYGERPKFGATFNLSIRKNKLSAYANFSSNHNYNVEQTTLLMDVNYLGDEVVSDMHAERRPYMGLNSGEVGVDYDLTDRTSLGIAFAGFNRDWKMESLAVTNRESSLSGSSQEITDSYEENQLFRFISNFHVQHQFSNSTQLSFDYDNIQFNRDNPTTYDVSFLESGIEVDQAEFLSTSETPLDINVARLDLQQKMSDNLNLEAGLKVTFSSFDSDVRVAFLTGDLFEDDPNFTDFFDLEEYIYAGYASADWQLNPTLRLKSGLRFESYGIDLNSRNEGSVIDRQRDRLFPSLFLGYRPSDLQEWSFSYVRRIQRPSFQILAPFFYFFDQNTLFTGNPNVIPTLSNQYQVDYRYRGIITTLQHSQYDRPIFYWQPELDEASQLFIIRYQQATRNETTALTVAVPWDVTNWWSTRHSFAGYYLRQKPIVEGREFTINSFNYVLTTTHSFKIMNDLELEAIGTYNSALREGVTRTGARPGLDLGLRKKFNSGASLSFNVNDVFDSISRWPLEVDLREESDIYYHLLFNTEGPVFRINFSMPFGNENLKTKKKRKSSSDEEQQRLN